jgi:hypothetical protein
MPEQPQTTDPDITQTLDQYYAQQDKQANDQLMQSIAASVGKDGDVEGEAQRLGYETGIGPDIAKRNMDEVRKRAAIQDTQNRQLTVTSPILARQLSDPSFAAIAHDQIDNLSTTEKIFNWIKSVPSAVSSIPNAVAQIPNDPSDQWNMVKNGWNNSDIANQWKSGQLSYEHAMLAWKTREGQANADDASRINEIDQQLQTIGAPKGAPGTVSQFAGQFAPMVEHGVTVGSEAGLAAGGVAALAGAVTGPGDLVIAPAAAATAFGAGFNTVLGTEGVQQAAGESYLAMMKKGIDRNTALAVSGYVGLLNGALQMGALKLIGHPLEQAASNMISKAVGDKLSEALVRPTVRQAVSRALFGFAGRTAATGVDMAAQDVVSQLGQDIASTYDKGTLSSSLQTPEGRSEFASHVVSAFVNGVLISASLGGAGSMIGLHADLSRAADADRSQQFFTALSENAADSDVRKRNPNSYEGFIGAQAAGSGAGTTYIDGQKMAEL